MNTVKCKALWSYQIYCQIFFLIINRWIRRCLSFLLILPYQEEENDFNCLPYNWLPNKSSNLCLPQMQESRSPFPTTTQQANLQHNFALELLHHYYNHYCQPCLYVSALTCNFSSSGLDLAQIQTLWKFAGRHKWLYFYFWLLAFLVENYLQTVKEMQTYNQMESLKGSVSSPISGARCISFRSFELICEEKVKAFTGCIRLCIPPQTFVLCWVQLFSIHCISTSRAV